jgi:hypothetical protein
MIGLDLPSRLAAIRNDEFAKRRGEGAPAEPLHNSICGLG